MNKLFVMKNKIISIIRLLFYFANIILAVLYLFPGSILGWLLYDNMYKQPQITSDIIVSTNHVYAFILLTILGVFSFNNKIKELFLYLFSISIIFELLHLIIPNRGFEFSDLFGNIIGVLIIYLMKNIFYILNRKKI